VWWMALNGIHFNKIKIFKLEPSCKSVNPLHYYYLKTTSPTLSCTRFVGLASSGGNCTTADEPSNFEDVNMYSDWIKRTMEDAGYPYQY